MKPSPPAAILTLNTGSSSIKFALYSYSPQHSEPSPQAYLYGCIDSLNTSPQLRIHNTEGDILIQEGLPTGSSSNSACQTLLDRLTDIASSLTLVAIGHRVVHGGAHYSQPCLVDEDTLNILNTLTPLAPLHQAHNIHGIQLFRQQRPNIPHIACFDTAFHHTQPPLATQFALPRTLTAAGVRRYGFHGLSYEYIQHILPRHTPRPLERTIIAHLGNGASMCALYQGKSQATSMGFSTLDGLMMGTRCGSLDPGVILYLMNTQNRDSANLENLLYHQSGLLGVSGISQDMRTLLNSDDPAAQEAIALFCYRCTREIGALATDIGGIDNLIFTGGIGENAPTIRERICTPLRWMGIHLDPLANKLQNPRISAKDSPIEILCLPTNENWMIAQHVTTFLHHNEMHLLMFNENHH